MRFGVLGPLAVWAGDGRPVPVPGLKVRALLAALLMSEGRPVSSDRLIEHLWGDEPPGNPAGTLSAKVSLLRRALDDAERGARKLVVSPPPGYLLRVDAEAVDERRFQALTARARETGDPYAKAALLSDALALWRGPAFADFGDEPFAQATITRLEEQRRTAVEDLAEIRLQLGDHDVVAGELGDHLAGQPLRERPRALHMLALYRAGRQTEALDSYAALRRHLADELGLEPSAHLADLHRAILAQDPALDPPVGSRVRATHRVTNLPTPLTALVGRDEAVTEVRAVLTGCRLVTLTGSGGVGKTRLALATAAPLVPAYADGVWLVELAGLDAASTGEVLAETVLAVLGVHDTATREAPVDRLAGALRSRQVLLVLDNCEHITEQAAELAGRLLAVAAGLRVLATSRQPLGLAGELVWPVPPLIVPGRVAGPSRDAGLDLVALRRFSAVELFVARAAAAARGFTLDADNAEAVAVLCRRLDGIPLALELAATRVRALGVHGLVARLDDRFRLLATGHRGVPPRQQTLLAMIEWSWELLGDRERTVLRRLAVHADGCTVDAAEAVCGDESLPAADVLDALARLVDRSLVVMADRSDGPRYRLLESVAAYGIEQMDKAGESERVRRRHHRYYTELAERAEPELRRSDQQRWLQRLDDDAANFRAALDDLVRRHEADLALRLVNALAWYWFLRGRLTEAGRSLRTALDVPGDAGPANRAKAAAWDTGTAFLKGDIAGWPERHLAALRLYRDIDDAGGRAKAEWFLAFAEIDLGDAAATGELINRALAGFRAVGDRWGEAAALSLRAKHAHVTGDLAAIERDGKRSAALFEAIGDRWGVLQANEWLGALAELTGDYEGATRLHRNGLRMAEELGLWPEVSGRLSWLGWVAMQRGDYPSAREHCERGLRIAIEQNSPLGAIFAEMGLAFAARREGLLDVAEKHLRHLLDQAEQRDTEQGHALYAASVLVEMGFVHELRGDAPAAKAHHLQALTFTEALGTSREVAWIMIGLAGAAVAGRRAEHAARLLGASAAAREASRMPIAPAEQGDIDRIATAARAVLGVSAFTDAFAEGRTASPSLR